MDCLFRLSESRGKEASGVAARIGESIYVFKSPIPSSKLIKTKEYSNIFDVLTNNGGYKDLKIPFAVVGHSRLATNGPSELNINNQPVVKDGAVGIHNGIIVNDAEIWKSFPVLKRKFDVDTEVFLSLLEMFRKKDISLVRAVKKTFQYIQGSASVSVLFDDISYVLFATNTGSLYTCRSNDGKLFMFSSEKYILRQLIKTKFMRMLFDENMISQVRPGTGCLVNILDLDEQIKFNLNGNMSDDIHTTFTIGPKVHIIELYPMDGITALLTNDKYTLKDDVKKAMMKTWERLYSRELNLRRCTKCLLPETMPYISFNEDGVCNFCTEHERKSYTPKGEKALKKVLAKYKSRSGKPDCVVGFSGGRDSSFGLDYIKNHLKMNPITFIYDWGMVTDLARRNQARVCGKLGIEQIVVSADIKKKREYIRKNLEAWLKRPDLGMVPMLMAGDKQFYHYFHEIRKQNGIKLFIFCGGNPAEECAGDFRYGFCDIDINRKEALKRVTGISIINKLKLLFYYFKQYVSNPGYINNSILDTLSAYYSTYILRDDYLYLYHYIDWNEEKVLSTIREKFDWEREADTKATWRIDDGTAAFYNYIYLAIAGFTEFDTFRSHQIREGKLTREEALKLVKEENKPRFKSIEWYAQTIDVDVNSAITIINSTPKRYLSSPN
jgi:glucosamine--fructose-6-phosphate aminotransferase (isomerizing)